MSGKSQVYGPAPNIPSPQDVKIRGASTRPPRAILRGTQDGSPLNDCPESGPLIDLAIMQLCSVNSDHFITFTVYTMAVMQ